MKKILLISSVIIMIILFIINNKQEDRNNITLPKNYTLDTYKVEKISDISCIKSSDCITPSEYLLRSNCPYTSLCIENKCNIVCPSHK